MCLETDIIVRFTSLFLDIYIYIYIIQYTTNLIYLDSHSDKDEHKMITQILDYAKSCD